MLMIDAQAADYALRSARLTILSFAVVNLCGEMHARTAWRVSVIALQRLLSTEGRVLVSHDISLMIYNNWTVCCIWVLIQTFVLISDIMLA